MRILKAEIHNLKSDRFADIELPASYEEMEDVFHMVDGTNENCETIINHFNSDINFLGNAELQPCNLYELNYLANLLNQMKEYEQWQFTSLVEIIYQDGNVNISELINTALNVPTLDCFHAPVNSDNDLGKFYVENELLPQLTDLDSISDELYEWVCDHLDLKQIGSEMREQEHGIFTSRGYFVKNEELKDFYDGNPVVPEPKDYVFCLELAEIPVGDEPNDEHTVSLKLPASKEEIQRVLDEIGVKEMSDCCFYGYESVAIPQLSDILGDNNDFDALNHLAEKIVSFDNDNLVKYKSMLEAVQCKDLETAILVYENMDDFNINRNINTPTDYVDKILDNLDLPLKEQFSFYLSKEGYGRILMQYNGVDQTPYGMLIPDLGIKLAEQIQKQQDTMEMNMSM